MKTLLSTLLLSAALLAAPACALAADAAQTPQEIVAFQRDLRAKLDAPTGDYKRYSPQQLEKMKRAQDSVFSMLDGVASLDALNQAQRIELSNKLDEIKATLLAREDSRMICHLERRTGSNMMVRRCETAASREENRREADIMLQRDGVGR